MSARVLSQVSGRMQPSAREVQRAVEKHWRERGYFDARCDKRRLERAEILELGGESAVHFYFQGFRCGKKVV